MRATPVNSYANWQADGSSGKDDSPPSDDSDSRTIKESDFESHNYSEQAEERETSSTATAIHNPHGLEYERRLQEELQLERDKEQLLGELRGHRIVTVHGVGLLSCSVVANPELEHLKQSVWTAYASQEHWLAAARAREVYFHEQGALRSPLCWRLVDDGHLPPGALPTGTDSAGVILYSARAWLDGGGLLVGRVAESSQGTCSVAFGSVEHLVPIYEVLTGDSSYAQWRTIPRQTAFSLDIASSRPIEGGRDLNGVCQFIAQAEFDGGWHPGTVALGSDHCCLAYGGGEVWVQPFRVLNWDLDTL